MFLTSVCPNPSFSCSSLANSCEILLVKSCFSCSEIESPFADGGGASASEADNLGSAVETFDGPLDLTLDNVEAVLDEMRPYLISDGGNVKVTEIDGPIVRLELVGECGTCPSSTQTMKMGLERKLKEKIPEIEEVRMKNKILEASATTPPSSLLFSNSSLCSFVTGRAGHPRGANSGYRAGGRGLGERPAFPGGGRGEHSV